ncbi:MAG: glycerol-3-phosphate 1-O-acyltransferase PlsY [Rickettsiales bacterium]
MNLSWIFEVFLISYIIGSIPFGFILTRLLGLGDIRSIGSGNIGATNVMRTGRKSLAIITLLLDALKGVLAVKLTSYLYNNELALLAAVFVVIGHIFPIWLKFKGGKGVATILGVFFAVNWIFALVICALWLATFLITRISSVSALLSIAYSPIISYMFDGYSMAVICFFLFLIVIYSHRHNISRLLNGTEMSFRSRRG